MIKNIILGSILPVGAAILLLNFVSEKISTDHPTNRESKTVQETAPLTPPEERRSDEKRETATSKIAAKTPSA